MHDKSKTVTHALPHLQLCGLLHAGVWSATAVVGLPVGEVAHDLL